MDNVKTQFGVGFVAAWFGMAVCLLAFSLIFTFYLSTAKRVSPINQNFKMYASLPQNTSEVTDEIQKSDGRAKIIENFFKDYKSLLSNFSEEFVTVSDKYNLDYRLLPAIAMQESNGGQKVINDSYNPFGYGIYSGSVIKFSSWEEAIERVGKALREDYLNKGLTTPYLIMTKYTPPSLEKGGSWAIGVSTFMAELK